MKKSKINYIVVEILTLYLKIYERFILRENTLNNNGFWVWILFKKTIFLEGDGFLGLGFG